MRLTFIVFALLASLGVFFGVYTLMGDGGSQQGVLQEPQVVVEKVPTKDVYVALTPLAVGDVIDQTKLDRQPWPENLISEGFIVAGSQGAAQITGMVARAPFQAGEVLMYSKLANPEDPGFLAAQLPEGMRAVTISTDPVAGLAGFIYPGDRVDVLFTHSLLSKEEKRMAIEEAEESGEKEKEVQEKRITEMLIADVRVLAVNQRAVITGDEKPRDLLPSSITLEVRQQDAQRLRLAEREGEVSLVLRSLHEDTAQFVRPSAENDLTRTLPPGFFEALYGEEGFMEDMPRQAQRSSEGKVKQVAMPSPKKEKQRNKVVVVRGVKVEEIEFESDE
jgi:pilus assembly protein CpaB